MTQLFPEMIKDGVDLILAIWLQNSMGITLLSYNCDQEALRAKQIVKGNQHDPKNLFRWNHIKENLGCSDIYNRLVHSLKKVWKDGDLALDIIQYIDDAQTIVLSEERSWLAQSKMVKRLSYLGLQNAVRKKWVANDLVFG